MVEPEDDDILAGEMVLGTLSGAERVAFAARLETDTALAARVAYWEERLVPLFSVIPPVEPPATLWPAIERAIAPPPRRVWNLIGFWRGLAVAATAAAAVLAGVLLTRPTVLPPVPAQVAVLADDSRQATWLVRAEPSSAMVSVTPLRRIEQPQDRAFELWLIAGPQSPPQSLGLLPSGGRTIAMPLDRLAPGVTLAVSLEPLQGSPTGLPTGPVLHVGTVIRTELN